MADMAASVLARLKNKAKESKRSYQLCLQLFCQEELLRRLEKSKYAENLVLKGGLFIYAVIVPGLQASASAMSAASKLNFSGDCEYY